MASASWEGSIIGARAVMRRVGFVLIALFVIDIVWFIADIASHRRSSLSFLDLIAGIALLLGDLKYVRLIRQGALFFLILLAGSLIFLIQIIPLPLLTTEIRLHDYSGILSVAYNIASALAALWVWRSLSSSVVEIALTRELGPSPWWDRRWIPVALAVCLGFLLPLVMIHAQSGDANTAIAAVEHRYGPSYQYATSSYAWRNGIAFVSVTAYSSTAIHRATVVIVNGRVQRMTDEP